MRARVLCNSEPLGAAMSSLQPLSSGSLSDEVFEKLVTAITLGEFELGQKLSEAELARSLGISRGPLREALGRLEGRLVTRTPRIGVRVIELNREKVQSLYIAREALEGMACRIAAEKMTDKQLAGLRAILETDSQRPEVSAGQSYTPTSYDEDFHWAIVQAAQSETIERVLMTEVYYQLRLLRRKSSARPGRAKAALTEHFRILGALEAHNPDEAETEMRAHLRNARYSSLAAIA